MLPAVPPYQGCGQNARATFNPMNNTLLEQLQSDVTALLKTTPALEYAVVLADNEGDIEARVLKALANLSGSNGKKGLGIVVLLPEAAKSEENLPGPPLTLKVEIQCIEQVMINRGELGTGMRSSQAALTVLSNLHLRGIGNLLLFAEDPPIKPIRVKQGFVSHSVALKARVDGFVSLRPPIPIAAWTDEDALELTGLIISVSGVATGQQIRYTTDGTFPDASASIYNAPITGLTVGTLVRAVIWDPSLGNSEMIEILVQGATPSVS